MSDAELTTGIEPKRPISFIRAEPAEARWRSWVRATSVVVVTVILIALGVANVAIRAQWHEVEDGVLWASRAEGVTAADVATGSAGEAAGIQRGDILVAVNGVPVEKPADVVEYQHKGHAGTRLSYTLVRLGTRQALDVSLAAIARTSSLY